MNTRILGCIATLALTACATAPAPVIIDQLLETTATVESIDLPARIVALRNEDGEIATLMLDDDIGNLDQVHVGDRVSVSYYEGLAAQVKKARKRVASDDEATETLVTLPGVRPAGGIDRTIRATVRIESVDTSFNTVTFRREDGLSRTVAVEDADAQRLLRKLRPGDNVEVTYTEALAVAVRPAT